MLKSNVKRQQAMQNVMNHIIAQTSVCVTNQKKQVELASPIPVNVQVEETNFVFCFLRVVSSV